MDDFRGDTNQRPFHNGNAAVRNFLLFFSMNSTPTSPPGHGCIRARRDSNRQHAHAIHRRTPVGAIAASAQQRIHWAKVPAVL